jgi:hypothetical protein
MKRWLWIAGAAFVGFAAGWIGGRKSMAPAFERCHDAVRFLIKGASMEQLQESGRLLRGE